MRVAFLLRGGISKTTGRTNFPTSLEVPGHYVNFAAVKKSIDRHIFEPNSKHQIDVFIHTWHPDIQDQILTLYSPKKYCIENNDWYRTELIRKLDQSQTPHNYYSQVSHCLSIQRGCDLVQQYVEQTSTEYDLVVLYKLDLLLWKDMILDQYATDDQNIIVNSFDDRRGDWHFAMTYNNMKLFSKVYDSISTENKPTDHSVIRNFVLNYMHKNLVEDQIVAGQDQEVVRKVIMQIERNTLTWENLAEYGLTKEEVLEYSIGVW